MNKIKSSIKLVIWDMDDTFWTGTLSEEDVKINPNNINIIKELIDRGIMCSISSKNDFEKVKTKLETIKIWDLFIFPRINWNPKAYQIKEIINDCNLRPDNVLFIDDNFHNLGEVKSLMPNINICEPKLIPTLLNNNNLKGKIDKEHSKLKQYKILEEKSKAKTSCSSNIEFLKNSNIKVEICTDCTNHQDRILDLINKSNQLNYTKIRLNNEQLSNILNDKSRKNYYVSVSDNYGDYGIVGFVSIFNNRAEHLLFSCRTIGMGVEQYVYSKLKYPDYTLNGEVINKLEINKCPSWINNRKNKKIQRKIIHLIYRF